MTPKLSSSTQVKIRPARAQDAEPLARVFASSWRLAYRGMIPHAHLEDLIARRGQSRWLDTIGKGERLLVLELNEVVVGYVTFGLARSRGRYQGEIYELYLEPTHQGLGLGEHLFEAARERMDMSRLRGLIVWALADNTQAQDFYWRRGGRPVRKAYETMGGVKLEKIAYGWG